MDSHLYSDNVESDDEIFTVVFTILEWNARVAFFYCASYDKSLRKWIVHCV